jgi:CHAT domain-containing protein
LSDEGSKSVMTKLYRLHLQEGLSWADALRQAQLSQLRGAIGLDTVAKSNGRQSTTTADSLGDEPPPDDLEETNDGSSLAHLYHWAAFTVSGKE